MTKNTANSNACSWGTSRHTSIGSISRWLACSALLLLSINAHANPKLYVFDCGLLSFDDISLFSVTNDETEVREMFVPCYLIEHDEGRLLWDSGLPIDLAGAANEFAASTLLIQQAEYEAAFQRADEVRGYDPSLFGALEDSERVLLNGDHDVFSDGTVRIIATPGHTAGHQVLLVDLAETGPVLLSGDLYHLEENRAWRRVPTMNVDVEQTLASMDRVERLLEETGATLWIEHNLELADRLRKAPGFYD